MDAASRRRLGRLLLVARGDAPGQLGGPPEAAERPRPRLRGNQYPSRPDSKFARISLRCPDASPLHAQRKRTSTFGSNTGPRASTDGGVSRPRDELCCNQTSHCLQGAVSLCAAWSGGAPEHAVEVLAKFGDIPTRAVGYRTGDEGLVSETALSVLRRAVGELRRRRGLRDDVQRRAGPAVSQGAAAVFAVAPVAARGRAQPRAVRAAAPEISRSARWSLREAQGVPPGRLPGPAGA